jgi:alkylation response protein AidB-like acyl-CoA dehydrogenase
MLRSSLAHVLTEESERPLGARLGELGWDDVLADDAAGAVQLLFEMKGRTLSSADALGPLVAQTIAAALETPHLATAQLVFPVSLHPERLSSRLDGDRLLVTGTCLAPLAAGAVAVVPVASDHGTGTIRLAIAEGASGLVARATAGTDPSAGLLQVDGVLDAAAVTWSDGDKAAAAWEAATATGRWALAAELVGIGRHVIDHAVDYAGQRVQYGRPIGTFQALQHRLASAHASVVGASHVVAEAATSGSAWTALIAKAVAGRAAEDACTQAQQTYGAIGFTWEHEFHRYLRRTYVLDWLLGDWRTLEFEAGSRLQATAEVPRIGTL